MTLTPLGVPIIMPGEDDEYFSVDQMARRFVDSFPSDHTRRAVRGDLTAENRRGTMSYFDWCRLAGVHPLMVHRRQVPAWVRYLGSRGLSPATMKRKVSTPRCFYRHVIDTEQQLEVNPFPDRNKPLRLTPVADESETRALTASEWLSIRRAVEKAGAWRDAAILTTLFYQGLRAAELCALSSTSLWWEGGQQLMKVVGKGGRTRVVVADSEVSSSITHMLASRPHGVEVQRFDGQSRLSPLFTDRHGSAMTPNQVKWVVKRWAEAGGVRGAVTPHCYRHTCATLMLAAGAPIREVQRFLGHANPATTQRYDARRQMIENSPVQVLHKAVEAAQMRRMSRG